MPSDAGELSYGKTPHEEAPREDVARGRGSRGRGPARTPGHVRAFGPGRVCLIGEHTDYNDGLALAFAIAQGVTVEGRPRAGGRVLARARDLNEEDEFALVAPLPAGGWRAFVRGMVAELQRAGLRPAGCELAIRGDLPRGAGMSSSAALEIALALALITLAGTAGEIERTELAKLCSRVENEWAGAHTGLLDQLTSLHGQEGMALRIDFATLAVEMVPLRLDGWRLATLDTGERRANATSGYNERRAECARACRLLGVASLHDADPAMVERLPEPLRARAHHVLGDNARVEETVQALRAGDLPAVARLLNEAHTSLRELMDVSTPTVEAAVRRVRAQGAAGARLLGGGFGGSVLALFPPGVAPLPVDACEVRPCTGAYVREL